MVPRHVRGRQPYSVQEDQEILLPPLSTQEAQPTNPLQVKVPGGEQELRHSQVHRRRRVVSEVLQGDSGSHQERSRAPRRARERSQEGQGNNNNPSCDSQALKAADE